MPNHVYEKETIIQAFDSILNKTFGEIDNVGMFEHIRAEGFNLQKGIAGAVIEQCVLGYDPDPKQEADLIVIDNEDYISTELKVTGMRTSDKGGRHYVAKEPMSITAVGIYDIAEQTFYNSHFWNKLEHMLIIYYHYLSGSAVKPYDYKDFPVKGYEFHEFDYNDRLALQHDWCYVHDFITYIVNNHPGPKTKEWKATVKKEYLAERNLLRRALSYIDLAPKYPPRFRLKKTVVNTIIAKHFGYKLEQLPGLYATISDIDKKCDELTREYKNKTIGELADLFNVPRLTKDGKENKGFAEQVTIKMFGGNSKKLNQIDLFSRFGLIAKTIVMTPTGGRTEDMKLYHIDFEEMIQDTYTEENGTVRPFTFEDSEMYSYFADHELLCIIYVEPPKDYIRNSENGKRVKVKNMLAENRFWGFYRLVFSDSFIYGVAQKAWQDTRQKIKGNTLEDVINYKDGKPIINKSGGIRSAPNFIKASQNNVFIRGSADDSSSAGKTECVNGIKMLPQYIWISGKAICEEIGLRPIDEEP